MTVSKETNGKTMTVTAEGRIENTSAEEFEQEVMSDIEGIEELILDLSGIDYISPAGLRVILSLQKTMNDQGSMKVTGVNENVKDIFDVTDFTDILSIE